MIAIVHSIYSQSVHAPALDAGLMDNDAERYCTNNYSKCIVFVTPHICLKYQIKADIESNIMSF